MSRASVLVVEDERIIAKGIERQLKLLGYAVAGLAATGAEAVAMATTSPPDIILMDIHLGAGIDGVEAAARIRKAVDVPVVFLTAHSDDSTLGRAKLTEPFGYVVKPYDDTDLRTAIEIGLYRHRAEKRLRENEQWLAAILGSIGDGVIATDEFGRVRFLNALASKMTGWSPLDAHGEDIRGVFRIVHAATRQPVPNPALGAIERGETLLLAADTVLIDRTGGELPIEDSAAPIRDPNGRAAGAVLVFRDISDRRRLEEHLRQAQKMEAVGQLAGGIAHDFNNIMTVITGLSELLLSGGIPPAEVTDSLRHIHDAGKRAALLTRQIMAFSRKQTLMPSVLSLNTVVRDMAEMVRRLIGTDIEFVTAPAAELHRVEADPTQVGQVILNLCANARDAMPGGGTLTVSTANATLGGETTRQYPDVKPGAYALMTVTDTGCGMPPTVLARAFEPFFTTKGVGEGTGLGLATVHGIVTQSGGHVAADSEVGAGTTFRVYFPAVADPIRPQIAAEVRLAPRGTETVLLVEDDDMVRRMTRAVLVGGGYTVLAAGEGAEGLAVAAAHAGPIHLLVTDLVMPGIKGTALAEQVRAVRPGVRVLFMSGYSEDAVSQRGLDAAAVDFLQKPFSIEALRVAVRAALDRA